MITRESWEQFEKILRDGEQYIAGGVVLLNRNVDPSIVFKKGWGHQIDLLFGCPSGKNT